MAIVLDGVIQTAPTLNSRISDSGQITGIPTLEEAADTALVLRSGSLPISLTVEEIRAIGPTLGQDSINAGTTAALIGGAPWSCSSWRSTARSSAAPWRSAWRSSCCSSSACWPPSAPPSRCPASPAWC
jgi:hypothetical protein